MSGEGALQTSTPLSHRFRHFFSFRAQQASGQDFVRTFGFGRVNRLLGFMSPDALKSQPCLQPHSSYRVLNCEPFQAGHAFTLPGKT